MNTVEIFEGDNELQIRINGVLLYNFHGHGYEFIQMAAQEEDVLLYTLQSDKRLFEKFIQQLREQGYFSTRYPHET